MKFLSKINPVVYLVIVFIALFFFFGFHNVLTSRPGSIHAWRQADCASMALNYYQDGMDFFNPELMQQNADGGASGHNISEFPVIYYLVAVLYNVFGYHEVIFRLLNLLIFLIGLVYLYKILLRFLENLFWALSVTLLFYSSAILVYYSPGFLPDTASLAFVFPGWYYFLQYLDSGRNKKLFISMVFFTFASLLKITAALSPLTITGLILLDFLGVFKNDRRNSLFDDKKLLIISLSGFFILNAVWLGYVFYFNKQHETTYFGTHIWPVWNLSAAEISNALDSMKERWISEFINTEVQIVYLILIILFIVKLKKARRIFLYSTGFLFLGTLMYILLFFEVIGKHDYYLINTSVLLFFVLMTGMETFKQSFPKIYGSLYIKIAFALLVMFAINNTKSKHKGRIKGWYEPYARYEILHNFEDYLTSIGVEKDDKVVIIPDNTPSLSLYLINRKGWSLMKYATSKDIAKCRLKGAVFLIINGKENYKANDFDSIPMERAGERDGVIVYRLLSDNRK